MTETCGTDLLAWGREILAAGPICDECFGRAFAKLGHGLTNAERGRSIRSLLLMLGDSSEAGTCWLCGGFFDQLDNWAQRAAYVAADIEFDTYLFGIRLTPRLQHFQSVFAERFSTGWLEPLKHSFNREAGKRFENLVGHGTVDFRNADVSLVVDPAADKLHIHVRSLYIYGRYKKLIRGIPQTRWPCRRCNGAGCQQCNNTGKQYPESVEEIIAAPVLLAAGSDASSFHGAGREDIDARMLGNGRPFVLEVLSPTIRTLNISQLQKQVNVSGSGKVEVNELAFVSKPTVAKVKETRSRKRYRVTVQLGNPIDDHTLAQAVSELAGPIHQRTPTRVSHRRADLIRQRSVISAQATLLSPTEAQVDIHADGGLYIKELISGDDCRTEPSLAAILKVSATVTELDVLSIDQTLHDVM